MHFLIVNLLLFLFFIFLTPKVLATEQFITIVNPVRGGDFFQLKSNNPLDNVKKQWEVIKNKNFSATWLLRPDILQEKEAINFFQSLPSTQELGLFMEITPTWASDAGVKYHQNLNWHAADAVFLT